ncbi:MAG: M20/M25/M40 family metallo-hydrolase [Planctomycetales bacterium]|nr:M20/M25/M40 family metallo-hydrolase [Planctomycetales bacterium]
MSTIKLDPVAVAQRLIRIPSETSQSNHEVTQAIAAFLDQLEFSIEELPYVDLHGQQKWAIAAARNPSQQAQSKGGLGYFCHTDVVSVDGWNCPHGGPWEANINEERLWGRGACDMKGSAACALSAISAIDRNLQAAPIYFFATGDEECGMEGARQLVAHSRYYADLTAQQGVGIVGEPTHLRVVNAHKGVSHLAVCSEGVTAHSSTSEGRNANWSLIPFLSYLLEVSERCERDAALLNTNFEPATLSLNVIIKNEPAVANITVGKAICHVFMRPMPGTEWQALCQEIAAQAEAMSLRATVFAPLHPVHTDNQRESVQAALALLGQNRADAVCYATDGCCFQQLKDLLIIGPGSIEQAHRPDEWIALQQLTLGAERYEDLFRRFVC